MKQATRDRLKADYQLKKNKIKGQGYEVKSFMSGSWSFTKNGVKSVLGFDYEHEVIDFILEYQPEANRIFYPYK